MRREEREMNDIICDWTRNNEEIGRKMYKNKIREKVIKMCVILGGSLLNGVTQLILRKRKG